MLMKRRQFEHFVEELQKLTKRQIAARPSG
jgi:hypothetical protein